MINTKTMKATTAISATNYANTKAGYRKYITALGYPEEITNNVVKGYVSSGAYMIISYKAFQNEHITEESIEQELENRIEEMNSKWFELTTIQGQDDNDEETDAYHMKMNLRRLINQQND